MIELLYDIPVLGLVFQFVGYLIDVLPIIAPTIIGAATPIALGAMCGFMNERSGVVNIGIEGMMLTAAFVAWWVASLTAQLLPAMPVGPLGMSPALLIGLGAALAAGMLVSLVHAWLSITVRADQIISGVIINIFAVGITGYLNLLISRSAPPSAGQFRAWDAPAFLADIPVIGWLLDALLSQGPIGLSLLVAVIVMQVLLFRSRWGLRTRAVGEHPEAAETVGIDVIGLRYRNVILGGVFAGLAGAYLTIEFGNSFQGEMTNGRGFIALAALIFGRWTPLGSFGAALLFTASEGIQRAVRFGPPEGALGDFLSSVPSQFYSALPYLITIIILAGVVGRSIAPAADGRPYSREKREKRAKASA
ncbi:MAG TPA: ABC transporter permease [Candidatus Limnocylindria bacterium]|nr:ABC transporter permease [Candidatus Limnocylindria bacterium]